MTWRNMFGCVVIILAAAVVSALWIGPNVTASSRLQAPTQVASANRQTIHAMPILERPSRPGHFYGNTVRRRSSRQTGHG